MTRDYEVPHIKGIRGVISNCRGRPISRNPWPEHKTVPFVRSQAEFSSGFCIRKKARSQSFGIRQRDEMTAGNLLYLLSKPFTRDTSLKFDREKAVISSRQNMNGDVGPVLKAAGLAENGVGLLTKLFRAGAQHAMRHVVQNANGEARGRPVGVAIDKTGALLIADDVGNTVWRVTAAGQ